MTLPRGDLGDFRRRLGEGFRGKLREREPMKGHTTFKIGGMADIMVWPETVSDIEAARDAAMASGVGLKTIGAGSNLLVGDGGIRGAVMNMSSSLDSFDVAGEDRESAEVEMGAGVKLIKAVKETQTRGLAGLEWASGIPGAVGGAAVMNAGSLGGSMMDRVAWIEWLAPGGGVERISADRLQYGYRRLCLPEGAIVLGLAARLEKDDPKAIRERIVTGLKRRRQTQPLSHPSAGSVFKNPEGDHAGRLVEEAGLKGRRLGDAQISDLHANFIVNRGRARSRDVLELIALAREEVFKLAGIELELEIEIVGEELP